MLEINKQSIRLGEAMYRASQMADERRDEFLTPEHLLWAISSQEEFLKATDLKAYLEHEDEHPTTFAIYDHIKKYSSTVPDGIDYDGASASALLEQIVMRGYSYMESSGAKQIDVPHVIHSMLMQEKSFAHDILVKICEGNTAELMSNIIEAYAADDTAVRVEYSTGNEEEQKAQKEWLQFVTCLNEQVANHNPLIGREEEIERTVQVLCRKDKNNPLHVGEPGVGKTSLAYGLAAKIESGDVPKRLKGSKVYALDIGALMAGTQYRGDFERRMKAVLEGAADTNNKSRSTARNILYIDEIHNLVGAGRIEGGSLDGANLMKPYLETGTLCFMGATTYEEYNRSFSRSKGFARRFEKIDIAEPTVEQCRQIVHGLKPKYEEFHHVVYTDEAIEYAVEASNKYITGRFLPDKAIDVIDEAGAWRETHLDDDMPIQVVDKKLVAEVLAHICNVDTLAEDKGNVEQLEHLEQHIKSQIYGQDEAVREVTEAVQMASAGLLDDNKPMASLLFVGPTGVGKTEVAKVLAKELSLPLLRFDMSEYAEKHTVAKLIGSPAGYVGYEDGGLLTDAIRKTPHCVLLFDELEKAHQDIYNILLQVMDYAVLTDNKGQKADFRHVIFIMTTNAGAQFARQASLGFVKNSTAGEAMMKSVKNTFKPEFLNRLTGITIFHDMNRSMAELILDKKLNSLGEKLSAKNVVMTLTDSARELLLKNGFSEEYGGREIDRVITTQLKPLLMRAILFGHLKNGGNAVVDAANGVLAIKEC